MKILLDINIKVFVFLFCSLIYVAETNCQILTTRQGEVLIQIEHGKNANILEAPLNSNFRMQNGFSFSQVIEAPMNIWKISFDFSKISEIEVLRFVKSNSDVINAQYNHLTSYRKTPNDSNFNDQWQYINLGLNGGLLGADLDADLAWDVTTGGITAAGDTIVVCIIDGGLDMNHQDFGSNRWVNRGEIPNNGIDDDGNGYIDDYKGWNLFSETDDIHPSNGDGHGTSVAGIVGAKGNNNLGVTGVNWDVKLMILQGVGDESIALAGFAYPYIMRKLYNETNGAKGAFVVATNSSWGVDLGQPDDAPIWCNFYDSLGQVGIINCAATSNNDSNIDEVGDLPTACSSDYILSVSNINRNGQKEQGAGYGINTIDIGAFGEDVYTTSIGNNYNEFGGTSAASPHAAGAVALAYAVSCSNFVDFYRQDPSAAALYIKSIILKSSKKSPEFTELFSSGGILNLNNMVTSVANNCSECPLPLNVSIDDLYIDSAIVNWVNPEDVDSFKLQYKSIGSEEWISFTNAESPAILNGLLPCTEYEVQVQSFCDVDSFSEFSFVQVFETLGCCNDPNPPSFSNAPDMVPEGAILLTWENSADYESYIIEYKFQDSEEWISEETNENSLLLEGVGFCNLVETRLSAICITGATTSTSEITTAYSGCGTCTSLDYCIVPDVFTDDEWIESITIDENKIVTGDNDGYINNAGFFDVNIPIKRTFDFKLDKGFDQAAFQEWVKVWIDFNADGVFDEDEVIFNEGEGTLDDIDTTLYLDRIFVPGLTKMRIGMTFAVEPSACEETSIASFGEYEDYCVNLYYEEPCDVGLEFIEIVATNTSAMVTYSMVDTSIAYNLRYKLVDEGDDEWNTISVIDTSASISPLEECSQYVVQVRAVCPVDTSGFAAVSDTFNTSGTGCMVATIDLNDLPLIEIVPYPNPFVDIVNLKIKSEISATANLEIYNIEGRRIFSTTYKLQIGERELSIPESTSWNGGIYFIRIQSDHYEYSKKVIKLRN